MPLDKEPPLNTCSRHKVINCNDCFGPMEHAITFVVRERRRQMREFGVPDPRPDGTAASKEHEALRTAFRNRLLHNESARTSWSSFLRCRMAEVACETEARALYTELGVLVATALAWMEDLERRNIRRPR